MTSNIVCDYLCFESAPYMISCGCTHSVNLCGFIIAGMNNELFVLFMKSVIGTSLARPRLMLSITPESLLREYYF